MKSISFCFRTTGMHCPKKKPRMNKNILVLSYTERTEEYQYITGAVESRKVNKKITIKKAKEK